MKTQLIALLFAASVSMATVACGPDYQRTDINAQVPAVPTNEINFSHVTVAQGTALKAHIASINSDNKTMGNGIRSEDATIMDVSGAISDHDYVFKGNKVGQTRIIIQADEDTVLILDAFVVAQPAAP